MSEKVPFAVQLRYERELRGWSQADVASNIQAETKSVARWENGKSFPRPYYVQALCQLFGKTPEEFGLVKNHTLTENTSEIEVRTYQNIIGFPPPTSPKTILQREKAVHHVYVQLRQPTVTAVVLTGIGGVGKSTLAALVYRLALERYQQNEGPFTAEPLWLTIQKSSTMADIVGTILELLGKPLSDPGTLTPQQQVLKLFSVLNAVENPRLIVLDQFENVLDWQTGYALSERPSVGEWLDVINSQPCMCKMLLTNRPWPRGTREYPPTYMQEYHLSGLDITEGVELLRKQGVETSQATEEQLQTAVIRCDGHAFALTLLASLLRKNRSLNLSLLFDNRVYARFWNGDIAHNLLDYIYIKQLNEVQRKLLFAFSIYRKPVPLEASMALIDLNNEDQHEQVFLALDVLLTQYLVHAQGDALYRPHTIIVNYLHGNFMGKYDKTGIQILQSAHIKAAEYYLAFADVVCPARDQRRSINDVQPFIEAIWHYCQAEQWRKAFALMQREEMYQDLRRWGSNAILLELHQLLLPFEKWQPSLAQQAELCDHLGRVQGTLGKKEAALALYEQSLHIYKAIGNSRDEGRTLNHIASVQENLGRVTLAKDLHEQALAILQEVNDQKGVADSLNGLAWIYRSLGQYQEALYYYTQALSRYRAVEYRIGEGDALNGLGLINRSLGEKDQALQFIKDSLYICQQINNRAGEARTLNYLGLIYADMGNVDEAFNYYKHSLIIREDIGDRNGIAVVLYNLGQLYFKEQQYSTALTCWLLAREIFAEIQSTQQNAAQGWMDRLHEVVGNEAFVELLTEVEAELSQWQHRSIITKIFRNHSAPLLP